MTVTMYGWLLFSAIAVGVLVWWLNRANAGDVDGREECEWWNCGACASCDRAEASYQDYLDDAEDAAQEAFERRLRAEANTQSEF